MSVHNIVVLGASFNGLGAAHNILRGLPDLETQTGKKFKVTIIANSEKFWWTMGAPRAMVKPFPKEIDDSFPSVIESLKPYPKEHVEFVHAEITGFDSSKREVSYVLLDDDEQKASSTSSLHFDTILIAIGSTGPDPLFALQGGYLQTYNAYKSVHARLPSANSILVVGGGAAGVETAGELGDLHGKHSSTPKDITILSGTSRLLSGLRPAIGKRAEELLTAQGVKTVHDVRVDNQKKLPGGGAQVTLSDGTTKDYDLVFVATGRVPASGVLPKDLLNDKGRVLTNSYLRVEGLESAYAAGDIASIAPLGLLTTKGQLNVVADNIIADLGGKGPAKEWKPFTTKEMQIVPVGPNAGVGAIFGWWAPSFVVKMLKSKHFFFPQAHNYLIGKA